LQCVSTNPDANNYHFTLSHPVQTHCNASLFASFNTYLNSFAIPYYTGKNNSNLFSKYSQHVLQFSQQGKSVSQQGITKRKQIANTLLLIAKHRKQGIDHSQMVAKCVQPCANIWQQGIPVSQQEMEFWQHVAEYYFQFNIWFCQDYHFPQSLSQPVIPSSLNYKPFKFSFNARLHSRIRCHV